MLTLRVTLVLLGTAAYLGLAMFGWGGFTTFFSHPALIALAIATPEVNPVLVALSSAARWQQRPCRPWIPEFRSASGKRRYGHVLAGCRSTVSPHLPCTQREGCWSMIDQQ